MTLHLLTGPAGPLAAAPLPAPAAELCGAARILTPSGARAAAALRPGDAVFTAGGGVTRLGAVTRRRIGAGAQPGRAPVRIRRGALGEGRPWRDLTVAPGQLLRLDGPAVEEFCGAETLLVAALLLVDDLAVTRVPAVATLLALTLSAPGGLMAEGLGTLPKDEAAPPPAPEATMLRALLAYFARAA